VKETSKTRYDLTSFQSQRVSVTNGQIISIEIVIKRRTRIQMILT
jgi:hypothetical protein